jgi:hypothetical protein
MPEPYDAGGISVTLKSDEPGGKFNDPKSPGTWIVFHGSPSHVKSQIIEVFDLDEKAAERPLYDLVNEATKLFKSVNAVGGQLGGTVLSKGSEKSEDGDVWQQVANANANSTPPAEEKADVDPILAALENCKTVADVQQIWAENQSAFNDNADYMAAYKARGKALS